MKVLLLLLAASMAVAQSYHDESDWQNFKARFGKSYKTQQEEQIKKKTFLENKEQVLNHNDRHASGLEHYTKRINKFSDMVSEFEVFLAVTIIGNQLMKNKKTSKF